MRYLTHLLILTATFTLVSCSVKEMREACPCRVALDFSNLLPKACAGGEIITTITGADGKNARSYRFGTDTCATRYEILLRKGKYTVSSLLTAGESLWSDEEEGIRLRPGAQSDSLFGEVSHLDASGEESESKPLALKQFTTLFILFSAPVSDLLTEVDIPSCFIRTEDLSAVESPFSISRRISGGTAGFRLPRQSGEGLSVTFFDGGRTQPLAFVDLAPLLRKNGYDFHARELSDITLIMDFGEGKATIAVEDWKESFIIVTF